jgi:DNA-binding transcriptional regulator of glucitol operon
VAVTSKYFSRRALGLHLALATWIGVCAVAAWWQVGRAIQGSSLSYFYAIEWPVFGIFGVLGWFALLNLEKVTEHQEKARREYEEHKRAEARAAREASGEPEDPILAAYNDHLAQIASSPKRKLWGH